MAISEGLTTESIISVLKAPLFRQHVHSAMNLTRRTNREHSFSAYKSIGGACELTKIVSGRESSVPIPLIKSENKYPFIIFHTHPKAGEQTPSPEDFVVLEYAMLYSQKQGLASRPLICVGKHSYQQSAKKYAIHLVFAQRLRSVTENLVNRTSQATDSLRLSYGGIIPAEESIEFYKNYVQKNYRMGIAMYYSKHGKLQLQEYGGRLFPEKRYPMRIETIMRDFEWKTRRINN